RHTSPTAVVSAETASESPGRTVAAPPRSLLVVDDHDASFRLVEAAVGELDAEATWAPTAEMGLQLAQLHRPAALVVDLFLPNESGAWFIEQVNAIPGFEHIPIVVWTVGDVSPTEHARLLAFPNVREIVSKGPGATPLIEVLRQVLPPLAQEAKDAR
ncbi:MAG TPA: response regulator, partial [Polyangiaceae bacterium]|nr:response regulator [Polyangiaceae bacterium]